ncbi:MAG: hypothetical protein ACE14M_16945 [Terriglobales bacterium]
MTADAFRIEPFESSLAAAPGEAFEVGVRVHNLGPTALSSEAPHPVHLSYHWLGPNGSMIVHDGLRTVLGSELKPFSSRVLRLRVLVPPHSGQLSLAIDLVREGVRWFGHPATGAALITVSVRSDPAADRQRRCEGRHLRTLLVSASDSAFTPLAKGLYLSLFACGLPSADVHAAFIDIENCPDARRWMYDRGVMVSLASDLQLGSQYTARPPLRYTGAQNIRPFLPELFPEYHSIVWLDSDTWVQNESSITILTSLPHIHPEMLFISPTVDTAYQKFYEDYSAYLHAYSQVYRSCYDESVAAEMSGRAVLSTGVFSLSARSVLWERWKAELATVYAKDYTGNLDTLHVAEQVALNVAAYRSRQFVPLEAIHNFHCHAGARVERDQRFGKVVVEQQPFREIGIVHLSDFPRHASDYLSRGLLWDRGAYLSEDELRALRDYRRKAP